MFELVDATPIPGITTTPDHPLASSLHQCGGHEAGYFQMNPVPVGEIKSALFDQLLDLFLQPVVELQHDELFHMLLEGNDGFFGGLCAGSHCFAPSLLKSGSGH